MAVACFLVMLKELVGRLDLLGVLILCVLGACDAPGTPTDAGPDVQQDADTPPGDSSPDALQDADRLHSDGSPDGHHDADDHRDSAPDAELVDTGPLGNIYFIGTDGVDREDCRGGTRDDPWKTFNGNVSSGCIEPGDVVYFLPGTYLADTSTFRDSFITFSGSEGMPVTIAADPEADSPVRFEGFFTLQGEWGVISGIEFYSSSSQRNRGAVLKIDGSHMTVRNVHVDGSEGGGFDCVKIVSGVSSGEHLHDIEITGSEIHHCPEDVIDVTGARNVRYHGNDLHHFPMLQIKGGTEDIVVENNLIHDFDLGIRGAGMSCPDRYCGSPYLPTIPVEDRFVARNVTIRNNIFYNSTGWDAIGAHGWQDVSIYHNTFYNIDKAILILGHRTGLDFYDEIADAYCTSHPGTCTHCDASTTCWNITFLAEDIRFRNNIIDHADQPVINILDERMRAALISSHNVYNPRSSESIRFTIESQSYELAEFSPESSSILQDPLLVSPEEGDFSLSSDSAAIDSGADLGLSVDFEGGSRDEYPDIGAYEYQP